MKSRLKPNIPWKLLPVVMTLAWPTMVEQLMQTVVQYIDTAMVGQLGTHATAAVGGTGTVAWLINSTISALGIGPWVQRFHQNLSYRKGGIVTYVSVALYIVLLIMTVAYLMNATYTSFLYFQF